ncbi:hypothetical protein ESCNG_80090 [Neisseria gonorrhoeae]|nr:hypothetical protein ESCNG_260013 [Neisseria gonorrhoeae]SCW15416.1 hypothetical protein ESCNG_250013 [Neisseria gonorrhoeae]SCW18808.1 hypothetical protein ESCNG_80090 [Neisseria gonorrhoeae]
MFAETFNYTTQIYLYGLLSY